jgi:hypothetical protein
VSLLVAVVLAWAVPCPAAVAPAAHRSSGEGRVRPHLRARFKPIASDSVVMLIGDMPWPGPGGWLTTLKDRIQLAAACGVDTVVLVCDTRTVEGSFEALDALLRLAERHGLGVMPRLIVDSAAFTERVPVTWPFVEQLPAYANTAQLAGAVSLLETVIRHLEGFPNVVAYQVEWGHYGESWINAPFWDSPSSTAAFLAFLKPLHPAFQRFSPADVAAWPLGQVMLTGSCLPPSDPRADPATVAEFHWYQHWRDATTRTITWTLRAAARSLTRRPIAGFSYAVGGPDGVIGHVYSAGEYLDLAFSDWTPMPGTAHEDFIRDAGFSGLHLAEFDFDTPYFTRDRAAQAAAAMAARGILPVIFYPHWSTALTDADIPALAALIRAHPPLSSPPPADVLLVLGHQQVGILGPFEIGLLPEGGAAVTANEPPGVVALLLGNGTSLDVASPDAYTPTLGDRYRLVVVCSPTEDHDGAFAAKVAATSSPVLVAHPSFLLGTPTRERPVVVTSAYCETFNPVALGSHTVGVQVWGQNTSSEPAPRIRFQGALAALGTLEGYTPNRTVFSFYDGPFDEVLAVAEFAQASHPTVARMGHVTFFGLITNLRDPLQRAVCQQALLATVATLVPEQRRVAAAPASCPRAPASP